MEEPFSSGSVIAVLLTSEAIFNNYKYSWFLDTSASDKVYLYVSISFVYTFQIWASVILFIVRVPVLSEQILLAPPIV